MSSHCWCYFWCSSRQPPWTLIFILFINDLPEVIPYSSNFMYANDVKMCLFYSDWPLQFDLNKFQKWFETNVLFLNYAKCKLITFYWSFPHLVSYSIGNHNLDPITTSNDLGVLFNQELCVYSHITAMVNNAKGVLASIKRWSNKFDDPYTTKTLYVALVRPILEYCSCMWIPQYKEPQTIIESVNITRPPT